MRLLRRLGNTGDLPWVLAILCFFAIQYRTAVLLGRHWLFGDNAFQNFPWHYYVWDRVRQGGLTAPCREMALGFPLFAEPQAQCFYPLNTALWPIADPFASFSLKLVLHMLGATVGLYALARWLGRSALGAATAALVLCGGSFMVYRVVHAPILFSLAWLPWIVLLYLRVLQTGSRLAFIGLVGTAAMQILTGHPQLSVYTVLACLIMGMASSPEVSTKPTGSEVEDFTKTRKSGPGLHWLRSVGLLAGAYSLGLLIAMVQVAPTYELYLYSWRTGMGDIDLVRQWGCSLKDLTVNLLAPAEATWKWEKAAYPGALAWVAVLYGLVAWRDRPARVLLTLVGVGLALSWSESNPLYDLVAYVPVLNRLRAPGRIALLITLGAALLLARLVDELRQGRCRPRALLGAVGATLVFMEAVALATTGQVGLGPWVEEDPLGWQFLVLVVMACAVAVVWRRLAGHCGALHRQSPPYSDDPSWKGQASAGSTVLAGLILALTAGELLLISRGINPAFTREEWLAQPDQRLYALAAERRAPNDGAFVRWRDGLPNNVSIYFDLPQARAFTPMAYPAMDATNTWLAGPNTPETLAAFGVDWVAADADRARQAGLQPVVQVDKWVLCRAPLRSERAYVPEELIPGDLGQAAQLLRDESCDPRRTVVVPRAVIGDQPLRCPNGQAEVLEDTPTRCVVRTRAEAAGLVVVTRLWAPFWSASMDGQATEVLAANMVLLATVISPGEHTVTFIWQPELLRPGLVSVLMALVWVGWLISEWRRRRRSSDTKRS